MSRVRLFNGFTFDQINHQIFAPVLVNPKLDTSTGKFTSTKAEANALVFGAFSGYKVVYTGNFTQDLVAGYTGRIDSITLKGPGNKTYYKIDNIDVKISLIDHWSAASLLAIDPDGVTELFFETGVNITLGNSADVFNGTSSSDVIRGGKGNDLIFGNDGSDKIYGDNGNDFLSGGRGKDVFFGGNGNDTIVVSGGTNKAYGGAGQDTFIGAAGKDTFLGGNDADTAYGKGGNDRLKGGDGDDFLFGDAGKDTLIGGNNKDYLQGDSGNDKLFGGKGADILLGGQGADTLTGGAHGDQFLFHNLSESGVGRGNRDVIVDFERGLDKIDLMFLNPLAQPFTFIGKQDFSGIAGELKYSKNNNATIIKIDTDGDGRSDFEIELASSMNLSVDDFIL